MTNGVHLPSQCNVCGVYINSPPGSSSMAARTLTIFTSYPRHNGCRTTCLSYMGGHKNSTTHLFQKIKGIPRTSISRKEPKKSSAPNRLVLFASIPPNQNARRKYSFVSSSTVLCSKNYLSFCLNGKKKAFKISPRSLTYNPHTHISRPAKFIFWNGALFSVCRPLGGDGPSVHLRGSNRGCNLLF